MWIEHPLINRTTEKLNHFRAMKNGILCDNGRNFVQIEIMS